MNRTDTITSSEIADFVYCQEAWRLAQLGHESANRRERDAGTAHHAGKAVAETMPGGSIALGRVLIVLALLAQAAWVLAR